MCPGGQSLFLRDVEVTCRLEHPNVVPIYGMGRKSDGRLYYAMRFVRGDSLADAIARLHASPSNGNNARSRRLEFRGLLDRFIVVCKTVAYAHSRGVIHRDLKPDNIMLGQYGETVVIDWGLAKVIDESNDDDRTSQALRPARQTGGASATEVGSVLGSPGYLSPEQAAGNGD